MLARLLIFFVMAVGLVGFGVTAWISTHPPQPKVAQGVAEAPKTKSVLVAADELRAGSLLKTGDFKNVDLPVAGLSADVVADSVEARAALVGSMVRHSIVQGQPILNADVLRPGDHGFLAAVLGSGKLAVTVAVDAVSGSAGLIWPGDHVNVVLTQTMTEQNLPQGRRVVAETVLSDVRVIAIDQHLMQGATGSNTEQAQAGTVTLEVTPQQDEKVAVASHLGHLSLAVLSAEGGVVEPTSKVTWASDVSPALASSMPAAPKNAAPPAAVHVFLGSTQAQEYRY